MAEMDRRAAGGQPGKRNSSHSRSRARAKAHKAAERYTIAGPVTVTTADGATAVRPPYTEAQQDEIYAKRKRG